jgi:hypothetical protein
MASREEMLSEAEGLERSLRRALAAQFRPPRRPGREHFNALSNNLKKLVSFYERRLAGGTPDPSGSVLTLLGQDVPRGRESWQALRQTLTADRLKNLRERFGPDGVTFILAWTARLLGPGAGG